MREPPIGYWLKRVDELLTAELATALARHGLDRFRWQLLNVIAESGTATVPDLAHRLRGFADTAALDAMLADLRTRRWIVSDADDVLSLTGAGNEAHVAALRAVTESRSRSTAGITAEDYATTVATLRTIAANLGHHD